MGNTQSVLIASTEVKMYEGKNVPALKAICKERGITGYSKLTKPKLLAALVTWDREQAAESNAAFAALETPEAAPIVVKGRSVGATTMAAAAAMAEPVRVRFKQYPNTTARNAAKRRRRAIRASGGVAGW